MLSAVVRFLRSRRWAVRLLVVIAAYSAFVTALPQRGLGETAVAEWEAARPGVFAVTDALGLHEGFSTPLFIALCVWLAAATIACAWERTAGALRERGRLSALPESTLKRLRDHPRIAVHVPDGIGADEALARATSALRSLGLRIHAGPRIVAGRSRMYGLIGSPLFHWSLALLFVVIAGGQLARSEGLMGVVVGGSKDDVEASYRLLDRGALHPELSGLEIAVVEMDRDYRVGDVEFGPTPLVELRRDGAVLARGFVRPNAPLRYRTMMIHGLDHGLAAVVSIDDGEESVEHEVLLDYDTGSATGVAAEGFVIDLADGPVAVVFDLPGDGPTAGETPQVEIAWGPEGADAPTRTEVVLQGGSVTIGEVTLTVERLTSYARLSVVDDWSVPYIYLLLTIAIVGSGIAILLPMRKAWALVRDDDGLRIHIDVRHARSDGLWPRRVGQAVSAAVEGGEVT